MGEIDFLEEKNLPAVAPSISLGKTSVAVISKILQGFKRITGLDAGFRIPYYFIGSPLSTWEPLVVLEQLRTLDIVEDGGTFTRDYPDEPNLIRFGVKHKNIDSTIHNASESGLHGC